MKTLYLSKTSIAKALDLMPEEISEHFWSDAELKMKEYIKYFLEQSLFYEAAEFIDRGWHERVKNGKKIYRNGNRKRKSLLTHFCGEISDFEIPRLRNAMFKSRILERYCRKTREFENALLTMYINGQSCRRVKRTIQKLFGVDLSAASVSAVLQSAQDKLDEWRNRTITKSYIALVIDGVHINLRVGLKSIKTGKKTTSGVVITVMGIREDGSKEILGFKTASGESKEACYGLLNDLYNRGLRLSADAPIILDGAEGFASAANEVFPYNPQQLCVFHFIKGVSEYAENKKQATKIQKELSFVYKTYIKQKDAKYALEIIVKKYWKINMRIAGYINKHYLKTLTYLEYDKNRHETFKTTNYIERSFKEIGRKLYDVGVFPNIRSAERIMFLQILELNYKENGEKPYYA